MSIPLAGARRPPHDQFLAAIDSHTGGQPTRVVYEGIPRFEYSTIAEARDILRSTYDWVRQCIVSNATGAPTLFGAALFPLEDEPADSMGVVFMDAAGYHDMCGHATIGVIATLMYLAAREDASGRTASIALHTPLGVIQTRAEAIDRGSVRVSFVNQPAFFLETVEGRAAGVAFDASVAFGGQWYAFVDARTFGLEIVQESIPDLVKLAADVRSSVADAITLPDPRTGAPPRVDNIMWFGGSPSGRADGRNMAVNVAGGYDRSPCGTGTSARLAVLHASGALRVGEEYVNESVLGTTYRARILSETALSGSPAIVPEITGCASLVGRVERWISFDDPAYA